MTPQRRLARDLARAFWDFFRGVGRDLLTVVLWASVLAVAAAVVAVLHEISPPWSGSASDWVSVIAGLVLAAVCSYTVWAMFWDGRG